MLYVDSVQKSGSTIKALKDKLLELGFKDENFQTCCIVNSGSYDHTPEPTYMSKKIKGTVVFPWGTVDMR